MACAVKTRARNPSRAVDSASGARQAPTLKVFGNDYPTPDGILRDYVHVLDLAAAHLLALERLEREGPTLAYNLGAGRGYSVLEVVEACRRSPATRFRLSPRLDGKGPARPVRGQRARPP